MYRHVAKATFNDNKKNLLVNSRDRDSRALQRAHILTPEQRGLEQRHMLWSVCFLLCFCMCCFFFGVFSAPVCACPDFCVVDGGVGGMACEEMEDSLPQRENSPKQRTGAI